MPTVVKEYFLLLMLLISIFPAYAADNQKNISKIQTQIQTVQQDIKTQQANREQLQQKLKQVELQLGDVTQRHQKIVTEQKNQQAVLKELQQKQTSYEKNLAVQQDALAAQVRSAYLLGQTEYLRLLLNQQDPSSINRNLSYYQYVTRYQLKLIQNLTMLIEQVNENKRVIAERTTELATLQKQQSQQLLAVKTKHSEREQSLKQLNTVIQSKDEQLKQLLANRALLERAVQQATERAATTQAAVGGEVVWPGGGSFAKAQGKLSWPTRGRMMARFNSPIEQSQIKLTGVLLGAPEGQNVYAIAPGRVVFADWMPGYGLLMIVDHGQGYMTLYGRNGSLFKKVGDQVKPAERIATVGKTGGYTQSGLYFALRKQGTPLNPQLWCRG
jgi:septal ring factor EnvC (AmiA/AmiB activator)